MVEKEDKQLGSGNENSADEASSCEIIRLMRLAREKSRDYAPYWEWPPDRRRVELQAAQVLREFLVRRGELVSGQLSQVSNDPPDVLLISSDGLRIGIEVTELVDSDAIERNVYRKQHGLPNTYDWSEWDEPRLKNNLTRIINLKEHKLTKVTPHYDDLFLAIITDEPIINELLASRVVEQCNLASFSISRAFFLLGYHPLTDTSLYPDGCAVFEVPLNK